MTVFVDNMRAPFGRMIMCHMWADTRRELFDMASHLGLPLKYWQRPERLNDHGCLPGMNASWEHFDISQSKRALAVAAGAVETDKYGPVEHTARLDIASGELERIVRGIKRLESVRKCRTRR